MVPNRRWVHTEPIGSCCISYFTPISHSRPGLPLIALQDAVQYGIGKEAEWKSKWFG